jgi:hypothetical protein
MQVEKQEEETPTKCIATQHKVFQLRVLITEGAVTGECAVYSEIHRL